MDIGGHCKEHEEHNGQMRRNIFATEHLSSNRMRAIAYTLLAVLAVSRCVAATSAKTEPVGPAATWVEAAVQNEVAILQQQGTFSVQYRERKVDSKGDVTRLMIESKDGGVARIIERNGKPITAAEDAAERTRLEDALNHPSEFLRHHHRDASTRNDAVELVRLMPKAMVYTYAPGQPQLPNVKAQQIVLDYTPNPKFHPPTMLSESLTGLAGRVWIDEETRHVTRIEGRVLRPVNFGFGILARLYPGGTVALEQVEAGDGHWVYSHVEDHLVVRAMMVKTMNENVDMRTSHIEPLPALVGYQEAIRMLLAEQIPLL
jgi:hypothetical protein